MKIVHIVLKGIPHCGGMEKYTEEVGARLVENGHEVIVYSMRHYGTKDKTYRGMQIKTIPCFKTKSFEKLSATLIATLYQCFEKEVDIVHFHAFGPAIFSFIPRLLGRKTIVQGHGLEWKRSKWGIIGKKFLKLSEIPSVRFPHAVTSVSRILKKYLLDKYGINSDYIPTGVNPPQVELPDKIKQYGLCGNDYIFFAARFVKEKGAHYLIQAFNRLDTNLKLVIAGSTKHEDKYKKELYRMAQHNKNIIFTEFVTGKVLREFFSNCYMFVLPSETEGLSTVLLEAMSYGNCCLVSDIPENKEAMEDNGYYFRNKNVESLREKMEYLVKNEDAVQAMKEKAQIHVLTKYCWDKIALDYEMLYMDMLVKPSLKDAALP